MLGAGHAKTKMEHSCLLTAYTLLNKRETRFCLERGQHGLLQDYSQTVTSHQLHSSSYSTLCSVISQQLSYLRPLKAGNSLARHSSSQLFSCNHVGSGFASGLFRPIPPVKRNMNSAYSISFLALHFKSKHQQREMLEKQRERHHRILTTVGSVRYPVKGGRAAYRLPKRETARSPWVQILFFPLRFC